MQPNKEPKCSECGDHHEDLVLHSRCHPNVPTWVWVVDGGNTIVVRCAACEKEITRLPLGPREATYH